MADPTPREPLPIDESAPRYAPSRSLPSHRYLPGFNARPEHSEEEPATIPERIHEAELFRFGVDLFNRSYFWEAHEAWETLWQRCPEGPTREGLQGLIQLAAANLKEALGVRQGAVKLSSSACAHLEAARRGGALDAIDLGALIWRALRHFGTTASGPEPGAASPGIRFRVNETNGS